jgi:signal recognition particle subunit SRP54
VAATHTPIVFIGTGEHMFDLERFQPRPFISKLLGMGDMQGLLEHVQALQLDQKDTMKHLAEGVFTVRDLRDQLANTLKMGPLSKMAGMIPGLGQMLGGGLDDEEGSMKLKRMIYMCDSMTDAELDSDASCFAKQPSRVTRVARGSGTSVREVEDLLAQHRVMAGMAKRMKGSMANMQRAQNAFGVGGGGGGVGGAAGGGHGHAGGSGSNSRGQQQQMAAMQKRLQSMGGALPGGMDLGAMMKAFGGGGGGGGGGAGGMPGGMDMASMMKQMGDLFGGGGGGAGRGRGRPKR